jgi:hypothetical protein
MDLRFSFPIELRIDLTSLPQGWKEEVVPFLLEQSITYERPRGQRSRVEGKEEQLLPHLLVINLLLLFCKKEKGCSSQTVCQFF